MPGKRARSALAEWDLWTDLRQVLTLINIHFVRFFVWGGEGAQVLGIEPLFEK